MLSAVDTRLSDVQRELDEMLPSDAILVGHSIANDLEAMKVSFLSFTMLILS